MYGARQGMGRAWVVQRETRLAANEVSAAAAVVALTSFAANLSEVGAVVDDVSLRASFPLSVHFSSLKLPTAGSSPTRGLA